MKLLLLNNLKNIFYVIVMFFSLQSCTNSTKQSEVSQTPKSEIKTSNENTEWMNFVNIKSDSIQTLYAENAYKVLTDGEILEGSQQIKDYLFQNNVVLQSIQSDTVIAAHKRRGLEYEIGEFLDSKNKKYKHLLIWKTKDSKRKRVFEFVEKIEPTNILLSEIENRRQLWMELCNKNNAADLINEMYSKNTLYFNHKPIVKGRDLLIQEYQYMNNEKYELTLSPEIVELVNKGFVFEIGQCKGSYNGKYILVWSKAENGKWEIFIDSNI